MHVFQMGAAACTLEQGGCREIRRSKLSFHSKWIQQSHSFSLGLLWSRKHRSESPPTQHPPSVCLCHSSSFYGPMPNSFLMQTCISIPLPLSFASSSNFTSRVIQSACSRVSVVSSLLRPGAGFPWGGSTNSSTRSDPHHRHTSIHRQLQTTDARPRRRDDFAELRRSIERRTRDRLCLHRIRGLVERT